MEPESIDSIVSDPPYGLSFMGKGWDTYNTDRKQRQNNKYEDFMYEVFGHALRVAKPGCHLLAFGGTRTFHRLTVAIEDAGWDIRDCLMWVYGSGFPKSHNLQGEWQGWGTALKPAWEPIILARKPLGGTVAANVLEHGTGAINVDGCRVGTDGGTCRDGKAHKPSDAGWENMRGHGIATLNAGRWPANLIHDGSEEVMGLFPQQTSGANPTRRNVAKFQNAYGEFAGQEECTAVRGADSGSAARFFYCAKASKRDRDEGCEGLEEREAGHYAQDEWSRQNMGNTPDAQRKPVRNHHPTVKPTDLMRYLCRLITPPDGLVFDPFTGSGSTGKAAMLEGFRFVGAELSPEYIEIALARIGHAAGRTRQKELALA